MEGPLPFAGDVIVLYHWKCMPAFWSSDSYFPTQSPIQWIGVRLHPSRQTKKSACNWLEIFIRRLFVLPHHIFYIDETKAQSQAFLFLNSGQLLADITQLAHSHHHSRHHECNTNHGQKISQQLTCNSGIDKPTCSLTALYHSPWNDSFPLVTNHQYHTDYSYHRVVMVLLSFLWFWRVLYSFNLVSIGVSYTSIFFSVLYPSSFILHSSVRLVSFELQMFWHRGK